ncbi:uncharacterized protein N7446_009361 [Penicillium canescens]|uniref:uncharacterized protein n=1 Tax=Penicillium canescens TaxID=5083 RepID=UPI0026DF730B|nr:uncharacterized protein N7446_009361 [Penicillium canescens]KAJ6046269.1 hypothetical protein N7444_007523 [Penicillium canescens]KAJ6053349.1 hypothetical protein N7446_009361 [Penicillium canescens]
MAKDKPTLVGVPPEIRLVILDILQLEDPQSIFSFAAVSRKLYSETNKYRFHDIQLTLVNRNKLTVDIDRWNKILRQNDSFSSVLRVTVQGSLPPIQEEGDEDKNLTAVPWSSAEDRDNINELTSREEFYEQDFGGKPHITPRPEYCGWSPLPEFLGQLFIQTDVPTCKLHIMTYNLPRHFHKQSSRHGTDWYEYQLATSPCLSSIVLSYNQKHYSRVMTSHENMMLYDLATRLAPNLTHVNIMDISSELPRRPNAPPGPTSNQSINGKPLQGLSLTGGDPWEWNKQSDYSDLRVLQLWDVDEAMLWTAASREYPALNSLAVQPSSEVKDETVRRFVCSLSPLDSLHLCGEYTQETFQAILDHHGESLRKLCLVPVGEYDRFDYRRITPEFLTLVRTHCPNLKDFRVPTIRSAGRREECDLYRALGQFPKVINLTLELQHCDQCADMDPGEYKDYVERDRRREMRIKEWFTNIAVDERLVREIFSFIARTSPLRRLRIGFDTSLRSVHPDFNYKGDRAITKFMSRQYVCFRCNDDRLIVREIGAKARKLKEDEDPCELGPRDEAFGYAGFSSVFPTHAELARRKELKQEKERQDLLFGLKCELAKVECNPNDPFSKKKAEKEKERIFLKFKWDHPDVLEWTEAMAEYKAQKEAEELAEEIAKLKAKETAEEEERRRFERWKWVHWREYAKLVWAEVIAEQRAEEEVKKKAEEHAKKMADPNRDWGDDSLDRKERDGRWADPPPRSDPGRWWERWYSHPLTDLEPEILFNCTR